MGLLSGKEFAQLGPQQKVNAILDEREGKRRASKESAQARACARRLAEAEKELLAEQEIAAAEAGMTDAERLDRRMRRLESQDAPPERSTTFDRPTGWSLAREAVRQKWQREAREREAEREETLGVSQAQERWDAERVQIEADRDAEIAEAQETIRAAREQANMKLGAMPARPTLQDYEVMAV